MRKNHLDEIIVDEDDVTSAIVAGKSLHHLTVDDSKWVEQYNNSVRAFSNGNALKYSLAGDSELEQFVIDCISVDNWNMPNEYKQLDILEYLYTRVSEELQMAKGDFVSSSSKWQRVEQEFQEFENRNMIPVLQYLVYLVATARANNIVLGVGRGSSVASYVLYLLGVHKVDSIQYNLDIKEFLK